MLVLRFFSLIDGSCHLNYDYNLYLTVFNSLWSPTETVSSIAIYLLTLLSLVSLCSCSLALSPEDIKLSSQSISFVATTISSELSPFSRHGCHLDFILLKLINPVNLKTIACIFNSPCNSYQSWVKNFSAEILSAIKKKSSLMRICTFSFCQTTQKICPSNNAFFYMSQDFLL